MNNFERGDKSKHKTVSIFSWKANNSVKKKEKTKRKRKEMVYLQDGICRNGNGVLKVVYTTVTQTKFPASKNEHQETIIRL